MTRARRLLTGGEVASGNGLDKGFYYRPTMFGDVDPGMRIAQEEIFGPTVAVIKVRDVDEAIQVSNGIKYGLSSSIFTQDVNRAFRAMRDLKAGITYINAGTIGAEVHLPFGGVKDTGNGHREAGQAALDFFTEWKSIYVDYSGKLQKAQIDTLAWRPTSSERRDALVERLCGSTLGAMDVVSVYIGVRLGLYRALADRGPSSSAELAEAAGLNERYVREWLEQQATTGILEVDDERRYTLPPGHDEALLDETSLNYIAPVGKLVVACVRPIDAVLAAFRSGDGVPYADYGADLHEGQAESSRPLFEHLLGSEWFPAIPDVHERLGADPPARVADVACGQGYSTMAIARAYPKARVDGIDLDEASIAAARENLAGSGVEDRVTFHGRDAADPRLQGQYDLVYMHEALHDMSYPVDALRACRGLLGEGGCVVVGDERVADTFTGCGRRRRAPLLRLQHPPLPAGRHGRRGRRGNGHGHARRHRAALRGGGGLRRLRGAADRERLLPLLSLDPLACRPGSRSSGDLVPARRPSRVDSRSGTASRTSSSTRSSGARTGRGRAGGVPHARRGSDLAGDAWVADGSYTASSATSCSSGLSSSSGSICRCESRFRGSGDGHGSGCAIGPSSGPATAKPGAVRSSAATRCFCGH